MPLKKLLWTPVLHPYGLETSIASCSSKASKCKLHWLTCLEHCKLNVALSVALSVAGRMTMPTQPILVQISFMVDQLFLPSARLVQRRPHKSRQCRRHSWRVKLRLKVDSQTSNKGKSAQSSSCLRTENRSCRDNCLCLSSSLDSQLCVGIYPTWEHAQVALASGQSSLFVVCCILTLQ